MNTYCGVEV